jgi:hypothetical protein
MAYYDANAIVRPHVRDAADNLKSWIRVGRAAGLDIVGLLREPGTFTREIDVRRTPFILNLSSPAARERTAWILATLRGVATDPTPDPEPTPDAPEAGGPTPARPVGNAWDWLLGIDPSSSFVVVAGPGAQPGGRETRPAANLDRLRGRRRRPGRARPGRRRRDRPGRIIPGMPLDSPPVARSI